MGTIQSSINSMIGAVAGAVGGNKLVGKTKTPNTPTQPTEDLIGNKLVEKIYGEMMRPNISAYNKKTSQAYSDAMETANVSSKFTKESPSKVFNEITNTKEFRQEIKDATKLLNTQNKNIAKLSIKLAQQLNFQQRKAQMKQNSKMEGGSK